MSENEKIIINTYGSEDAPAAADFRRGATTPAEIEQAVTVNRDRAEQISPDDLAKRDI